MTNTDGLFDIIKGAGRRVTADAGDVLFHEGADLFAVPFVESGRIRVFKRSHDGHEITLYDIDPGESCVLAAGSILAGKRYPANAVADSPVVVWLLDDSVVQSLFDSNRVFRSWIFDLLSLRIIDLMSLVEEVAFKKMDVRLALYLIDRADANGQLSTTHETIATELGTAREVVSRILRQFEVEQAIVIGRARISISDRSKLADRANRA